MTDCRILPPCLAILLLVTACQTVATDEDVAAILVQPSDAARAELQHAVNSAFGTDVMLSDDALTESSVLTIENQQPRTIETDRPQGRVYGMPAKLNLVKRGDRCYLIDTRTGTRYLLEGATCRPE